MSDMLLGISQEYLYFQGKTPQLVSDVHNPYFLAFPGSNAKAETVRKNLIERWEKNKIDHEELSKIKEIGEIETYNIEVFVILPHQEKFSKFIQRNHLSYLI